MLQYHNSQVWIEQLGGRMDW